MKKDLVSIVVRTKNESFWIGKCLHAIQNQLYKNYEIIVIDNKSTDKTLKIIKKYEKLIDIWISEPDEGIFDAMNKGIEISKGKIISILKYQKVIDLFQMLP